MQHRNTKKVSNEKKESDNDDDMDWALQYQAYLDEKEQARDDEGDKDEEGKENEKVAEEGEEWAREYAAYCAEKEKDFFEANKPKE